MADITYTVSEITPNSVEGTEVINSQDQQLVQPFTLNSTFDSTKHKVELHILTLAGELIQSDYDYTNYSILQGAQVGEQGASLLSIDPVMDVKKYNYSTADTKLLYHFYDDVFSQDKTPAQFFIREISPDRTELQLISTDLTSETVQQTTAVVKGKLERQAYFDELRLNFKNNDLLIVTNIDTLVQDNLVTVVVKLYEPLPQNFRIKDLLTITQFVSDSVAYEVDSSIELEQPKQQYISPANFNLEIVDESVVPTGYLNYNELFSYQVSNSTNEIYSLISEKGVELSIDHSDFSTFIHFSSAEERLLNFKYKLDLLASYYADIAVISNATAGLQEVTGSIAYYENLVKGIVNNFDHYERFLYYESGSDSWPKTNTAPPYINDLSSTGTEWFSNKRLEAVLYDNGNLNRLLNTIPNYIKDDPDNANYSLFVDMIAQHFDTLWLYAKAISDKYDGDNRLNFGISKDLVGEALKNFGVKLYTSNKSVEDLFTSFVGQSYASGSEVINHYITGSLTGSNTPINPTSYSNYEKEIQKRIYHNIPLLLKSKGTERGLRALINCFGIPSDILTIKTYGGRNVEETPFYGDYQYYTSSLDKIRVDNTGSIVEGSTLSNLVSIQGRGKEYTDDLHTIEVGFSPTDNVNNYIVSYSLATQSLANFRIDDYIGDPRNLTSDSYAILDSTGNTVESLAKLAENITSTLTPYDVADYVRLIKFFDNTIFKVIRDFVPARAGVDTGIIIKPHILHRSKAKSALVTVTQVDYSQSIDTAFATASNGSTFGNRDQYTTVGFLDPNSTTSNFRVIQTPVGLGRDYRHGQEEAKFDGELEGSGIVVTDGNLTKANTNLTQLFTTFNYDIVLISGSDEICLLNTTQTPLQIIPNQEYQSATFFTGPQTYSIYTASAAGATTIYPTFPYTFTDSQFKQYDIVKLQATASNITNCQVSTQAMYASCSVIALTYFIPDQFTPNQVYNITTWFTPTENTNIKYYINNQEILTPQAYIFPGIPGTNYTVEARDSTIETYGLTCRTGVTKQLNGGCPITLPGNTRQYRYDDQEYFQPVNTVNPKTYIVCRRDIGLSISSLFLGITDPNTQYKVELKDYTGNLTVVNPGTNPSRNAITTPWTGEERITLSKAAGETWWEWEIAGGDFQPGDYWNANSNLGGYSIYITAYNTNPLYGTCERRVVVEEPQPEPTDPNICIQGVDYECTPDESGRFGVSFLPFSNRVCILDSNACII